ncbi:MULTISPECIES: trypsin-like serine peptidase [unclassified Bradyrhizobium]|uniref:trypsin-like serine peptidase n=1 Tax=unclassified Bradyrhizobium TaxID=2631580 RepID=UPI002915F9BA|nr:MULTISPECIES: trypsin-like peptidase domain-containing protein [unclassified Bradyrhizobium]
MSKELDPATPATVSGKLYARLTRGPAASVGTSLESASKAAAPLDDARIEQSIGLLSQALKRAKTNYPSSAEVADMVTNGAETGLKKLAAEGAAATLSTNEHLGVEAVIHADGSRPVFFIRRGEVERTGVEAGKWGEALDSHIRAIREVLPVVGRIGVRQSRFSYSGTGFLVGQDLVVTNRHVLQTFAVQGTDGNWNLYQDATIDFLGEIDNPATLSFKITKVVFAGPELILGLDPKRLDVALVAIEPLTAGATLPAPAVLSSKSGTVSSRRDLYVVGFPAAADLYYGSGDPAVGTEFADVLSSLFRDEFGVKRLAPGQIDAGIGTVDDGGKQWAFEHDASTMGGNSGSMVTDFGDGSTVIGLHFGGGPRRENYAHAFATLKSQLAGFGVNYAD